MATDEQKKIAADFLRSLVNPNDDVQEGALLAVAEELSPAPAVDPRIEVGAKALYESLLSPGFTDIEWETTLNQEGYRLDVKAVLAAVDAMPSRLKALKDADGDIWEEDSDSTWTMTTFANGKSRGSGPFHDYTNLTRGQLEDQHGPITEVTE